MAERIPRAIVPVRSGIQLPSIEAVNVRQTEVISVSRLDNVPRPVTARLVAPAIRNTPPPVTSSLRAPVLNTPELDVIQYEPPTFNPADMKPVTGANGGSEGNSQESEDTRDLPTPDLSGVPETPVIDVPFIGEVPVPPASTIALSGTTAVATVTATLIGKEVATALLRWMKPVVKQVILKLKKALSRDLTPYELQELMLFEGEKKLTKRLKAEQKAEKLRQATVHQAPLRQRIQMRMERKDGSRPQP